MRVWCGLKVSIVKKQGLAKNRIGKRVCDLRAVGRGDKINQKDGSRSR